MPKTKTKPSLKDLKKVQKLLQGAHDYVEINGFDIDVYADYNSGEKPNGINHGRVCYIGAMRYAAGLAPEPDDVYNEIGATDPTVPELTYAYEVLDEIAKRKLDSDTKLDIKRDHTNTHGHYVEALGYDIRDGDRDYDQQAEAALKIFRRALTKVYKDIEKAQAAK